MNSNNNLFGATMRYGLIFGALVIVSKLILWPLQLSESTGLVLIFFINVFVWVLEVLLLIFFMKKFRDEVTKKTTTFAQSYMVGILTVIFGAIIVAIYNFIFHGWIEPDFNQLTTEITMNKMVAFYQNIGATDEQIDQVMDAVGKVDTTITPVQVMIGSLKGSFIGGAILSIIGALIVKKNKPENGFESAMSEIDNDKN